MLLSLNPDIRALAPALLAVTLCLALSAGAQSPACKRRGG
jgi:hypothetical protein